MGKESHDKSMKKIQKENEQLSKELAEKKQEVKNQRKNYGERMTDVRIRLDEAKAETEENIKLKLKFDYLNSENKIEQAESRATDLMSELINNRLRHDTELNNLKETHDNSMKKIKKENEQLSKELVEKKQEVKNQRRNYGERMTDVRIRLDEAKAEERIIKAKLDVN